MDFNQAIETAKKRFTVAQWVIGIGGGLLVAPKWEMYDLPNAAPMTVPTVQPKKK